MADDEQFSLCWNNFNSNLSAGFHESLCRGDLVDVTLAAEGQFVKAHRLVLSVCSPYFRKMFTQMPANQHAFVFLKDVSHTALKDLIQFMYCGEVNVKQEALPAFISTAEALQIKGLTDSDPPPSQSPAEPSTPTPQQIQQIASPRVRQRTSATRSYKIETVDDSGDDKQATQIVIQTTTAPPPPQTSIAQQTQHLQQPQSQTHVAPQQMNTAATTTAVVTHKRPARSIGSGPHIKRTKSTIDPLDTADGSTGPQQITVQTAVVSVGDTKTQVQQAQDTEYIDLPMELPTKSEPDYAEDAGEVEGGENETTYVEDDSYGEMRYDDSYFTENEDAAGNATATTQATSGTVAGGGTTATTSSKALVKQQQPSFTDTSYVETADQTNNDAQEKKPYQEFVDGFIKLSTLPKILDGKFYKNIQPNRKTCNGIQATCTACMGIISGTTKSTGNFLSHIKRRHKDILASCQQYCQTKSTNSATEKMSSSEKLLTRPHLKQSMTQVLSTIATSSTLATTGPVPAALLWHHPPMPLSTTITATGFESAKSSASTNGYVLRKVESTQQQDF